MTDRFRRGGALAGLLLVLGGAGCSAPAPGVARGEAVWGTCVPCHGENGQGNQTLGAPAIAGLPQWYLEAQLQKFRDGVRGTHPSDTVGIRMKSMALTLRIEGDLESVAEYVAALPATHPAATLAGDPTAGQATFSSTCAVCHGANGEGMERSQAPPLAGQSDWYLLAQYEKFLGGRRGAHPEDVFGMGMAAQAKITPVESAVNVFAYLSTLQ